MSSTSAPLGDIPHRITSVHDLTTRDLGILWDDFKIWAFRTAHKLNKRGNASNLVAFVAALELTQDSSSDPCQASRREQAGFVRWYNEQFIAGFIERRDALAAARARRMATTN